MFFGVERLFCKKYRRRFWKGLGAYLSTGSKNDSMMSSKDLEKTGFWTSPDFQNFELKWAPVPWSPFSRYTYKSQKLFVETKIGLFVWECTLYQKNGYWIIKPNAYSLGRAFEYELMVNIPVVYGYSQPIYMSTSKTEPCEIILNVPASYDGPLAIKFSISRIKPVSETKCLLQLLKTSKFSDVSLVARGGEEIPAYKAVLSLHSNVLAAMLEHKSMKENQLHRIEIDDFDYTVIGEMWHFMLMDTSPNMEEMAPELLAISDKYNLIKLKRLAEETLQSHLNVETAVRSLVLGDLHGVNELKTKSMEIIEANLSTIMLQEDWQSLHSKHLHLFLEVLNIKKSN